MKIHPTLAFAPALLAAIVVACSSDDGGGSSPTTSPDASQPDAPLPTDMDGSMPSDGATSDAPPEPQCAPLAGNPTWTFVDKPTPWTGNVDANPLGAKVVGAIALAYGNGKFVLLAKSANESKLTWATSTDGTTWTPHEQALTPDPQVSNVGNLIWTGKEFVFVAFHGTGGFYAYKSADGLTWTSSKVADAANMFKIVSDAGTAVFVGANGSMFTSHDLGTWKQEHPEPGNGFGYLDIAAGGGHFVATANVNVGPFVSPDGETWTKIESIPSNVTYGKGAFHARGGGAWKKSVDGTTWIDEPQTGTSFATTDGGPSTFAGNRFLLYRVDGQGKGAGSFAMSLDGATWQEWGTNADGLATLQQRGVVPFQIAYGACHYVLAGNYTALDGTSSPYVVVSTAPPAP